MLDKEENLGRENSGKKQRKRGEQKDTGKGEGKEENQGRQNVRQASITAATCWQVRGPAYCTSAVGRVARRGPSFTHLPQ